MTQRALIVRGGWPGHQPVETTDLFLPFLHEQGYDVRIEGSPEVYSDAEAMGATDLVVQCVTMGEITPEASQGLSAAVARGTGLVGWHGGIADSFRSSSDYLQLVGGQFVAHPAKPVAERVGDHTDTLPRHRYELTGLGRQHPITKGLDGFDLVTEQYWVLHDDLIDVLATTTHPVQAEQPWRRPVMSPAIWTRAWGAGRVVVATPGHSVDAVSHPSVRTVIERGMLWATRTA